MRRRSATTTVNTPTSTQRETSSSQHAPAAWIRVETVNGRLEHTGTASCVRGESLGGRGCAAGWTFDAGTLRIQTDPFGMQPLFWSRTPDGVILSHNPLGVLKGGASNGLDEGALGVFLRLGFFLDDRTAFSAVRAVPEGLDLTWSNGVMPDVTPPSREVPDRIQDTSSAIEALHEAFVDAMRPRACEGPFGLPLTGGKDSRLLLAGLREVGCVPDFGFTAERPEARVGDGRTAPSVADAVGLEHRFVPITGAFDDVERAKNLATGFTTDEHHVIAMLADAVVGVTPVMYDGIAGDSLSGKIYASRERYEIARRGRFDDLAANALEHYEATEPFLARVLGPERAARMTRERARASIADEMRRYADAPCPVSAFVFWNRTRREISSAPHALYPDSIRVHTPFLDPRVVSVLRSVPGEILHARDLRRDVLARLCPALDAVPYNTGGRGASAMMWPMPQLSRMRQRAIKRRKRRESEHPDTPEHALPSHWRARMLLFRQLTAFVGEG